MSKVLKWRGKSEKVFRFTYVEKNLFLEFILIQN